MKIRQIVKNVLRACLLFLFTSFLCFITYALPETIFLGHKANLTFSIIVPDNLHKTIMITLYDMTNIQSIKYFFSCPVLNLRHET